VQAQAAGLERYAPLVVGLFDRGHVIEPLRGRLLLASAGEAAALRLASQAGPLAARIRPFAPALVHAHFATDGLLALPLARALGVPLVTSLRGYDVSRSAWSMLASGRLSWMRYALLKRRLAAQGDLFLAVSDALRRKAIAGGYPAERLLVHYNGVDLACFRAEGKAEPGLILHVGRLVEKKGTELLIRAFRDVKSRHPGARLAIAGEGPLGPRLRAQSAALGLGESVRFLGALEPDEVAAWMRRAWLLAAPSLTAGDGDSEGLPNVVVEAAASGLPAVGSDHAGIPEAVIDGETGFIVPERDAAGLAARLDELLGSERLRRDMGEAARRLAEEKFDAKRQMRKLEAHYDRLTGRAAPGQAGEQGCA
jgi:colanic acid/amylovoran biosynthesis glycosyltransferase